MSPVEPLVERHWQSAAEAQTAALAARLAALLKPPMRVYLSGDLGAGKTCWVRGLLRALGETAPVPSPSYVLANTYAVSGAIVHHLDCFRLQNKPAGDELLELLDDDAALCFVEWPDSATNLPPPDLAMHFEIIAGDLRHISCSARSDRAAAILSATEA